MMKYFAYGSNLLPSRIQQRLGPIVSIGKAILIDHQLNFSKISVDGSGKCTILPLPGQHVYGVVYDLTLESKSLLDEIEGVGKGYESVIHNIDGFGECFAYVAQASYVDDNIAPYEWYKRLVMEGCRFHSFPAKYIKMVQSFDSVSDQNELRTRDNFRLIKD